MCTGPPDTALQEPQFHEGASFGPRRKSWWHWPRRALERHGGDALARRGGHHLITADTNATEEHCYQLHSPHRAGGGHPDSSAEKGSGNQLLGVLSHFLQSDLGFGLFGLSACWHGVLPSGEIGEWTSQHPLWFSCFRTSLPATW